MVHAFKILKILYQNNHIKDGFLFLIIYLESAFKVRSKVRSIAIFQIFCTYAFKSTLASWSCVPNMDRAERIVVDAGKLLSVHVKIHGKFSQMLKCMGNVWENSQKGNQKKGNLTLVDIKCVMEN